MQVSFGAEVQPPFNDLERGGVQAAWGAGERADHVIHGGLTAVDALTSGILAFNALDGAQYVISHTTNDHLHELAWSTGAVSHANLNTLAPAVASAGRASAHIFQPDRSQHAIHRDADGHRRDLSWITLGGIILLSAPATSRYDADARRPKRQ